MEISHNTIETHRITPFAVEDRFLKLPFENLLDVHGITPIEPQFGLVNAVNDPRFRFVVAALSRRTGKTFISNLIAHAVLLMPGTNVLVMAPNYSLANISWDEQRRYIRDFGIEVTKSNSKDRIMELQNGSSIRMGSIMQADSVVGRSYDLILFDECALDKGGQDVFNVQLRPTLDKPNSKAIFISTPRGHNWFYDFWQRGFSDSSEWSRWAAIRSSVEDNPRASEEDVLDAKHSMSDAEFQQEYYCSFAAMQGLIWKFNKENIKTIPTEDGDWDVVCGLDMGFRDHTAFIVCLTDGYNVYIADEYQDNGKTTAKHAENIKMLADKYEADMIYIDHAAAQTKYDLAYTYDIACINANKSKLDGIGYVASLSEWDRIYVDPKCTNVIAMFENYRWDIRPNKIKEEPVHDDFCHMADALRYALYTYAPNMNGMEGFD